MYYLNLDPDGWLLSISTVGNETGPAIESLEPFDFSADRLGAYRWDGTSLSFDAEKYAEILAEEAAAGRTASKLDIIEAQVYYTAMMTETLIDEEEA